MVEKNENNEIIRKTFPAKDSSLPMIMEFIEGELEKQEASMKVVMQVETAVEEMFVNIAHYSYPDKDGDAIIEIEHKEGEISIALIDEGLAFNPLAKEDPDITLSAEERSIGGLGIFMVKKSMDTVHYERTDNKNIFVMTKKIN